MAIVIGPLMAVVRGAPPADAAAHKAWMNDATDQQDELREALAARSRPPAVAAATKLAGLMEQTEAYWAGKKAADIVALAQQAGKAATATAAAAKSGQFDRARAAFDTMNASCNACHDRHPEKR